jgi:hypothetical protein
MGAGCTARIITTKRRRLPRPATFFTCAPGTFSRGGNSQWQAAPECPMHTTAMQLQFLLVTSLSLLGLAAAGSVLLIRSLEQRAAALGRPRNAAARAQWRAQVRAWRRRHAVAAAALAAMLVLFGVFVFSRQMG